MTKTFPLLALGTIVASAGVTPLAAQALPGAIIAVVDVQRASNECNACKAASAQIEAQAAQLRARAQQLGAPLDAEAKAIDAAVTALNGKEADEALQRRYQAFQASQQKAQQELAQRQQVLARNQAFASQQIDRALDPVLTKVMQARGANIMIDSNATMRISTSVDVTNDVLAELNKTLTSVSTTAPAPAPAAAAPKAAAPAAATTPTKTTPKKK